MSGASEAKAATTEASASASAGPPMALLYVLTLVVAACSILYELLLAQTLSALLGNSVLRYSVTIGCYLGALGVGAMICGAEPARPWRRLARIELGLSVLGTLSVPLFYLFDELQRQLYYGGGALDGSDGVLLGFFVATHVVILAIGVLSGFEVPLLLALGERRTPGSTNRVLGVDYFGALVGSVLFPTLLLPKLGLLASAFAVALVNGLACVVVVASAGDGVRPRPRAFLLPALAVLLAVFALAKADAIEQRFLRAYYYPQHVDSIGDLFRPIEGGERVQHHHSGYQGIDIVYDPDHESQWLIEQLSSRRRGDAAYPNDLWLYLDGEFQLFSGSDEFYHEWFAHAPIQLLGEVPARALILGGGDGMLLRELVKYEDVEAIVHVELDPVMLELGRSHPDLSAMNHGGYGDPRVDQIEADAFSWLRRTDGVFDVIYIDMPLARDYNHSMVYSREFYALVRSHLTDAGVVMIDAPEGGCYGPRWPHYTNTLMAAGFADPLAVTSSVAIDVGPLQERIAAVDRFTVREGGEDVTYEGDEAREALADLYVERLEEIPEHEFIVAFAGAAPAPAEVEWQDFGVELDAFDPAHLDLAVRWECDVDSAPEAVNSIFRPTIPAPELLSAPRSP